jgi:hypothetical protein
MIFIHLFNSFLDHSIQTLHILHLEDNKINYNGVQYVAGSLQKNTVKQLF